MTAAQECPAVPKCARRSRGHRTASTWTDGATPFGLFAGVATAEFGPQAQAGWGEEHVAVGRAGAEWLVGFKCEHGGLPVTALGVCEGVDNSAELFAGKACTFRLWLRLHGELNSLRTRRPLRLPPPVGDGQHNPVRRSA